MTSDLLNKLIPRLKSLTPNQIVLISSVVDTLGQPSEYWRLDTSDVVSPQFLSSFGDVLRFHHSFSREPFTKDKFEYAVEQIYNEEGRQAQLAHRGNPGHDITVDGERWSLKTQADKNIKQGFLHISKFMELGKGEWHDESDLIGLREQFLEHMGSYDRIFSLRRLPSDMPTLRRYELVKIPKGLMSKAGGGEIKMRHESKQNPKPGTCTVFGENQAMLFELYFDGGTERKLQVRKLSKQFCIVHATWQF